MQERAILELSMADLQGLVQTELQQNPVLDEVRSLSTGLAADVTENTTGELVLPDLILRQIGSTYILTINRGPIPRLRISEHYEALAAEPSASPDVKEYIRAKTDAAKRLIEDLEQREKFVFAIGRVIIESQRNFLENRSRDPIAKIAFPRSVLPPCLAEFGPRKALSNKYIETPFGIFELACFFSS
jgi:RNA polymerase sigma-54 factor